MTVPRRQSSHHRAWSVSNAARSLRPRVAVSSPGADTWEKKNSVTKCTVSNKIVNSRLNAYICPHSFTPLASKTQIPPRCGRDYTKETGICRQHSAARHSNGGKPEDAPQQYRDVTTIRQTRHFRSRRRQISRWRRIWYKQTGGGRRFLPLLLRSFNVLLALAYFAIRYTHRTTVVLWYDGLCDIRVLFMHDASQCAWRITPIRFNNARLSPLIFRPNISGLLRPRVLKPLHHPTRASCNEVSNLGAIEVGLHFAQVPNSCRKWNRIFIFLFSFTVHSIWCIPLFDELSQSLKQLSTYA